MTVLEEVSNLVTKIAPACICDDCITEKLELTVRQHANHKSRELAQASEFLRIKRACSVCNADKLSISYQR